MPRPRRPWPAAPFRAIVPEDTRDLWQVPETRVVAKGDELEPPAGSIASPRLTRAISGSRLQRPKNTAEPN